MKKTTFIKSFLLAAALCVGASAWAETETTTLLSIDYSTTTTPAWTVVGGSGSIIDGAWKHEQGGGNGPRSSYLDFGVNSSIDNNWSASFDVTTTTGSTWTQDSKFQIALASDGAAYPGDVSNAFLSSKVLLGARIVTTKSNMGAALACTITLNDVDAAETVTLNHGTKYTFNVVVNGTDLTASIKNGSTTVYSGSTTLAAFVKPRGIFDLLPRPYNATWGVYANTFDNVLVTKEVEAGSVEVPTAAITGVNGTKRTVSFACATEGVDFSYSTDGGTTFTDGSSIEISETTTIYVKATKGSNSATSEGLVFEAGTEISLNTPKWVKNSYSAGVSSVTLTSDQSNKLLSPVATIKYKINNGEAQTFSSTLNVNDGETLTYWAEAAGYSNSAEASVVAVAPCTYPTVFSENYYSVEDKIGITKDIAAEEVGGTQYYYMVAGGVRISDKLVTSSDNANNDYWLYRNGGIYSGVGKSYAILGVQEGDYVTITFQRGDGAPSVNATDATLDEWNSTSTSNVYNVIGTTGAVRFSIARYGYIKSITIQRMYALASGSAVHLTFDNAGTTGANDNNWKIDFFSNGTKVANVRADWWDEVADGNAGYTYGYTYSSDGGTTASTVGINWETFQSDMTNANIDLTLSNSNGTLYLIGTMTKGDNVYYVNYKKTGLTGDLTYNLYGNNATLSNIKTADATVTTAPAHPTAISAGNVGSTGYSTFTSTLYPLDLSYITGATAYYAKTVDTTNKKVVIESTTTSVPAGEGLLLKGTAGDAVKINIADEGTAIYGNKLVGCKEATTLTANANYYVLVNNNGAEFQCLDTNGATIPAGKAYLNAGRAGARLSIVFSDEATGISAVENADMQNVQYYNLNGQRTMAPQKGLYIVNGKKVVLK